MAENWVQIKESKAKNMPLSTLPFINAKSVKNPTIESTLKVWTTIICFKDRTSERQSEEFQPSVGVSGFSRWDNAGLWNLKSDEKI